MINYSYFTDSFNNALDTTNLTPAEVEARRERMEILSIMVTLSNDGDTQCYFVMMHAAIYGINHGLTDDQILNCINSHFDYKQMCALMDLVASGISDDMLKMLKKRTHAYNTLQYAYIPHIDEVEEIRLAQQRAKNHSIRHANLNDLTEMNNRRGFCSHYYFINGVPVSFVKEDEDTHAHCEICNQRVSSFVENRLKHAISEFDIGCECAVPNTSHYDAAGYNYYTLKRLGII